MASFGAMEMAFFDDKKFKQNRVLKTLFRPIQGPKSSQILNEIVDGVKNLNFMSGNWFSFENQKIYITRSGYTGEDGFEISISNDFVDKLARELIKNGSKLIILNREKTDLDIYADLVINDEIGSFLSKNINSPSPERTRT